MLRFAFAFTALFIAFADVRVEARDVFFGPATVVDGDTIVVEGEKLRLSGIDAPELDQTCFDASGTAFACGKVARDGLQRMIEGQSVRCVSEGRDRYGRFLARCSLGELDLQAWMVREGLAVSFVRYSNVYDADEAHARAAGAGLWAGRFVMPWDWRRRS